MLTLLISSMTINVYADQIDTTKIKLGDIYVNVPYNQNDIIVEYEKSDVETRAIIRDKITNEILDIHGEYIETLGKLPQSVLNQLPEELQIKAIKMKNANKNNTTIAANKGNFLLR